MGWMLMLQQGWSFCSHPNLFHECRGEIIVPAAELLILCFLQALSGFLSETSVGVHRDCPSRSTRFWGDASGRSELMAGHHPNLPRHAPNHPTSALSLGKIWGQKNMLASKHWSAKINWITERQNNAVCFRAQLHLDSNFHSAIHLI